MTDRAEKSDPGQAFTFGPRAAEYNYRRGIHEFAVASIPREARLKRIALSSSRGRWIIRMLRALLTGAATERRRTLIAKKYLDGERLGAGDMKVLRRDWFERFERGITDESYGRRKILRIPRDGDGCLDWCFPMPATKREWEDLAEGLGIPAAELRKLGSKSV